MVSIVHRSDFSFNMTYHRDVFKNNHYYFMTVYNALKYIGHK